MRFQTSGVYLPESVDAAVADSAIDKVCPFSSSALNEEQLAERIFPDAGNKSRKIGRYLSVYVGAAKTKGFRERGSSGGLTNWILSKLLETGKVDGVIGVGESGLSAEGAPMFTYQIARTPEAITKFSKSKYYPVELSRVLAEVRQTPGRYAVVGVPCFIKAVRNLCIADPVFAERIAYTAAIVCGHLKSSAFAENLAWQVGVEPKELKRFDFRVKVENEPANRYAITAEGVRNGNEIKRSKQVFDLYGTDWGLGFFKLKSCDYCDDIAGETADVVLGDAWLPAEVKDWRGTNILVVRHPEIRALLENARDSEEIELRDADESEFVTSQAANYRHRHDGLSVRLAVADEAHVWRPLKRIAADANSVSPGRREVMRLRTQLAELSHVAHQKARKDNSLQDFFREMRLPVLAYYKASKSLVKYIVKSTLIQLRKFRSS